MWSDEEWRDSLRVQFADAHAERLARAESAADPDLAREYHAQVRTLRWVLDRVADADRAGPGIVA